MLAGILQAPAPTVAGEVPDCQTRPASKVPHAAPAVADDVGLGFKVCNPTKQLVTEHRQLKQIKVKINPPASSSDRSRDMPANLYISRFSK